MKKEMDEIKRVSIKIDGWLTDREGKALFELAKQCPKKTVIVEIGSYKGKSTIYLAKGSKAGNKVRIYAIDPHEGVNKKEDTFYQFINNIKKAEVDDIIIPLKMTSEKAYDDFNEKIGLIFIDGDHSYDAVEYDTLHWILNVVDKGMMVFHDSTYFPGVRKAVDKYVYKSLQFKNIRLVDSITIAEKSAGAIGFGDIIRNRFMLLLKDLYIFGSRLKIPAPIKKVGKRIFRGVLK